MITRMGHVAIRTRDIEASARFYREVLGMREAFRMHNKDGTIGSIHLYVTDWQFIELFPNGSTLCPVGADTIGLHHLCFQVDNAHQALAELQAKGAPIDADCTIGRSRCIQLWTHDPDGNQIELMELPPDSLQAQAVQRMQGTINKR